MKISLKFLKDFPEKEFNDLVKRNLESQGIIINPQKDLYEGDSSFVVKGKELKIAAYDGDKMIGLCYGRAKTKNIFMMRLSLVEKKYRRKGIYGKMLNLTLKNTKEFDMIESHHHLFNNEIIALKLKRSFYITGMVNSIEIGPKLILKYYHNEKLLEMMRFRVGQQDPHVSD